MLKTRKFIIMKCVKLKYLLGVVLFLNTQCKIGNIIQVTNLDPTVVLFYDKNSNSKVVYQIYKYEEGVETNLTNDYAYNYWWPKVNSNKTKFLCYQSPKISNKMLENKTSDYANASLMTFDIDGKNPKTIITKGQYGWKEMGVAKWSPDGTEILMAVMCKDISRGSNEFLWRLVVTDSNGNNPKIISQRKGLFADPAWSPDGRRIVYVTLPPNYLFGVQDQFEIYVADYRKNLGIMENEIRLTFDDKYCFDPNWSNDGNRIAFSKCKFFDLIPLPGNADIATIKPDGSDEKIVMDDNRINGVPYWAPDNKTLYFHTLGFGLDFSIATCNGVEGNKKKIVLLGGGNDRNLYTTPQVVFK